VFATNQAFQGRFGNATAYDAPAIMLYQTNQGTARQPSLFTNPFYEQAAPVSYTP